METYATALSYAIPGFILLILIEYVISRIKGVAVNQGMDTISSISSGITNTLKTLMGLTVIILGYDVLVDHIALFEIKSTAMVAVLAFIGLDFAGYWTHRFEHVINVFWNRHIIHHSSEEFNLACALRQNVSAIVQIFFFLYIPMALLGIPVEIIAIIAPIHFFAQFWYHTQLIDKMGFLEHVLVTPSHHRVHHAINDEYLDRNYSQIFIVWDKWFGTFQEELPKKPPVYGVKKPVRTWNPFIINYMHFWGLIKDAWRAKSWKDKVRIWFMPTGWRPSDAANKYPIEITEDPYNRPKYQTPASLALLLWSWGQLTITILLMYYLLVSIADLTFWQVVGYCIFLMVSIFAYTSLMDRHRIGIYSEILKAMAGFALLWYNPGWFGLDAYVPVASLVVGSYLVISLGLNVYFGFVEKQDMTVPTQGKNAAMRYAEEKVAV